MAQYDVYRLADGAGIVVDCQSDLFDSYGARVCVPLLPPEVAPMIVARLNPRFDIDGTSLVLVPHFIAAIPAAELGEKIAALGDRHLAITGALDMLFTGF